MNEYNVYIYMLNSGVAILNTYKQNKTKPINLCNY